MSSPASARSTTEHPTPMGLIVFAWAFVGVPLVYGLYQTVKTALTLFTG
jgi:hypothetical protein